MLVDGDWVPATLRTYDVAADGSVHRVLSYEGPDCTRTGPFPSHQLRTRSGGPLSAEHLSA